MEKEVIQNVIVDRCRACSGVWLDGGELDLLRKAIQAGAGGDFTMGLVIGMGGGMAPGH
jgi:Zn-finger nucleic acid-binding protein